MKRANTFVVRPLTDDDEQVIRDLLDASAALWNEINYQRLMRYNDVDGFEGGVWDADTGALEGKYKAVLGASTAQTVRRANTEAWRSFFENKKAYHDESNTSVTEHPEPPGFRGNEDDGRVLKGVVRKDAYTVEWSDRSRLEIVVGKELRDNHNSPKSRLRLEIVGDPNWPDYEDQGRLELWYDETDCTFRASQPVTVSDETRDTPLANEKAALDIGANNLVACTTTTGQQYLYEGRELFQRFRETTREIARLQSKLKEGRYSSRRIRRLYRKRTRRRDHAQEALCRGLLERLYAEGVDTVYTGGLTDVLDTHWSAETNAKTHNFWAFKQFTERLACTAEEYGIAVEVRSEAWTSQECPQCGGTGRTTRHQDTLTCPCGFEGHADLTASETFLRRQTEQTVRPMARPVRFEWDSHEWLESPRSPATESPKEQRTDPSTVHRDGNVASGDSQTV
ncbi:MULTISPECIES: RNA-guided endonuclease InsQ/TnpB family protein [Halorubrum]|uniref:RNA-guided endonuclease InsQ/TnpB family protein n=1 Tax=Halorubrum TaxID=56688 RepID=UPI0010F5B871|nr:MULTISPECIES: RNA-guided endonuclease TnpB family protein [Halorubrum]MDB2242982.1 transposase [Halorubrum ezzemoulense]MDB2286993.1 transposase [Halorubrum ezzemoulense]TKX63976.1 transposase [Halorubrum sp. GN12_10-3_MGM]